MSMSSRILIKNWLCIRNSRHLSLVKNLVDNSISSSRNRSVICPAVTSWRSYSSSSRSPAATAEEKLSPVEIPQFEQRHDEPTETIRARLLYQSRKRGMLENDLLLSTFAGKFLAGFTLEELKEYDQLINCPSNDWDIYYWATGVKPIPPEFDTKIMSQFVEHVTNTKREKRLRQPNLY